MPRFLAAAVALTLSPAFAQVDAALAAKLERVIQDGAAAASIPGVSAAVFLGDSSPWLGAFGFADVENAVPVREDSRFRLASISKPLTALAAMSLVESGKLDLDSPVQKYIPSFPEKPWPVTMRLLMSHQAGIRHYAGDEFNSVRHFAGVTQSIEIFSQDPLVHEPGTKYLYSTYGFNLAGAVVESASGEPYARFVQRAVLEPAGVTGIQPDDVFALIPFRVRGYAKRDDGSLRNCGLADTSNKLPGGGWLGTAESVARLGWALLEGHLIAGNTRVLMWAAVPMKSGKPSAYGLGWGINQIGNETYYEHSGGQQGTSTHWIVMPSRRISIAVLTNLESSPATGIARELLRIVVESGE